MPKSQREDLYQALGVARDASDEAIKKAEEVMPDALERLDPDWRPQI